MESKTWRSMRRALHLHFGSMMKGMSVDWFERLTGFKELDYAGTQSRLRVEGGLLRSHAHDCAHAVGDFELLSLDTLRQRVRDLQPVAGHLRVSDVKGDVRQMHRMPEHAGALFQMASQFNLLDMVSPEVTPEQGVARYASDLTQGPACAIASGAATLYRNYLAPVGDGRGQTRDRQLDGLADLGLALSAALGRPVADLWQMRNGYVLCQPEGWMPSRLSFQRWTNQGLMICARGCASACTGMLKSRTCPSKQVRSSRRPCARRCLWPTRGLRASAGAALRPWCWRPPTKRRCWRGCSMHGAGGRTSCC